MAKEIALNPAHCLPPTVNLPSISESFSDGRTVHLWVAFLDCGSKEWRFLGWVIGPMHDGSGMRRGTVMPTAGLHEFKETINRTLSFYRFKTM